MMDAAALRWALEFLQVFFLSAIFFYLALSRRGLK